MRSQLRTHALVFAAAFASTLGIWWPVADAWFVLDDHRWLTWPGGREVLRYLYGSWGHGEAYRPVVRLSLLFDLLVFGHRPLGWHLHGFFWHAATITLVFALVRGVLSRVTQLDRSGPTLIASAVTALFAVSPLSHENVAWISGRTHSVMAAFFLASLLALFLAGQHTDRRNAGRLFALGAGLYAVALGSYEAAFTLPLVAGLTAVWFPSLVRASRTRVLTAFGLLGAITALALLHRLLVFRGSLGQTSPTTAWWYWEALAWGWRVYIGEHWWWRIGAVGVLIGMLLCLLARASSLPPEQGRMLRRVTWYVVVAGLVCFLPFSNVTGIADRFLYLTQLSYVAIVVAFLWALARGSARGRVAAIVILCVMLVTGAVLSRQWARIWSRNAHITRTIADQLRVLYPEWPPGTNVALKGRLRGVLILYRRDAVFYHYPAGVRGNLYLGDGLDPGPIPEQRTKYFVFDVATLTLREVDAAEWFGARL